MVGRAVRMASEHSLDPLFYVYPPVAFYVFAAAEAVVGALPGGHLGPATQVDPSLEVLAARVISALAAVAAVGATWAAGARAYGARSATVAAAALAVAPLAVRQAHFATTDALETALVAVALWLGARAAGPRGLVLAGVAAGAATATKYTAGAALVYVLVLALGQRRRGEAVLAGLVAFAISFVVLFLPTGHGRAYGDGLAFLGGRAGGFAGMPPGWLYHATRSLPFGLGMGAYALALAGVLVAAVRRSRHDLALLAYLVAAYLPLAASREDFFRYTLPLLPALCLLAGGALRAVPDHLALPALAGAMLLLAPSAWNSILGDRLLGVTDTRAQAAAWLDANLAPGTYVQVPSYWGQPFYSADELGHNPLHPLYATGDPVADSFQLGRFTERFRMVPPATAAGTACVALTESGPPWQAFDQEPRAAVARFPAARPGTGGVYDPLDSFYLPIWGFDGVQRPGPEIAILSGCR